MHDIYRVIEVEIDSQGRGGIVAGVSGKRILVTSLVISEHREPDQRPSSLAIMSLNSDWTSGGKVVGNLEMDQPNILPFHPYGWFISEVGHGLVFSGGMEARTINGCMTYREV